MYSHHTTHAPLVVMFSSYNITIQLAPKCVVRESQQNSRTITVFYDSWALMECMPYSKETSGSALQAV